MYRLVKVTVVVLLTLEVGWVHFSLETQIFFFFWLVDLWKLKLKLLHNVKCHHENMKSTTHSKHININIR